MKNKGITLLSLIVTVIIMLILATVTIKAITDNGTVQKTKEAVEAYQREAENEKFQLALIGAKDFVTGEIDTDKLKEALGEKWNVEEKEEEKKINIISPTEKDFSINYEKPPVKNEVFPIVIKVGDNATLTWKNDGKMKITGTGSTYSLEEGVGSVIDGVTEKLDKLSDVSINIMDFSLGQIVGMYVLSTIDYNIDQTEEEFFEILYSMLYESNTEVAEILNTNKTEIINALSKVNKITEIEFCEGITEIGSRFINISGYVETLKFPSTLEKICDHAISEVLYENPVTIPANVTEFGKWALETGIILNMERTSADGMTLPDFFEQNYIVNWAN